MKYLITFFVFLNLLLAWHIIGTQVRGFQFSFELAERHACEIEWGFDWQTLTVTHAACPWR